MPNSIVMDGEGWRCTDSRNLMFYIQQIYAFIYSTVYDCCDTSASANHSTKLRFECGGNFSGHSELHYANLIHLEGKQKSNIEMFHSVNSGLLPSF